MNSLMETVCLVCTTVRDKTKQGISFQSLLRVIRKEFKNHDVDLYLRTSRKKYLNNEEFYVNAYYDAEDDKNKDTPIEVIVYHNFDKDVIWDRLHITDLLVQVFDAVVHELKHQRQSKKRKYESYWDHAGQKAHYYDYLADPDEVDAYAISIAIELCRTLGKFRALRYLPKFTSLARFKIKDTYASPTLGAYVGQFQNINDIVLKKLAKKVYVRLMKVDTDMIFL